MRVFQLDASLAPDDLPAEGVVCHDVRAPRGQADVLARKGSRLTRDDLLALLGRGVADLHLAVPDPSDLGEDDAALRLAAAVAGEGVVLGRPRFGQVTLASAIRGLVRVHPDRLRRVNQQSGVLAMTGLPDCAADRGASLGVVKCAPLFLDERVIGAVEAIRAADGPAVEVVPFQPRRAAFLAPSTRVRGAAFERATDSLAQALEWFGSSLHRVLRTDATPAAVADCLRRAADGSDLILVAGATATDPFDALFEGLRAAGGEVYQVGIPAEPGTACWIGRFEGRPVLGLASCELFGRPGALDLLLPRLLAGEALDGDLLLRVALGGLLIGGPSRVLPYHRAQDG